MANLTAPISAVTVFTDRARVTRTGQAHLEPGEQVLSILDVPLTIQEDSVRAGGKGSNVKISGVEVVRQFVTEPPEVNFAALKKQLEELEERDRELADNDATEAGRLDFLGGLRETGGSFLARGIAYGKADVERIRSLEQYIAEEQPSVQGRRRRIAQQRKDLARDIEAVKARMNPQLGSIERRQINVVLTAEEETEVEVDVSYAVSGASWSPLYDIRLVADKVQVSYLAEVRQSSGEDWQDVVLSLSTARPAVSTTIPELDPWYLDIFKPGPIYSPSVRAKAAVGGVAYPAASAQVAEDYAEAAAPIAMEEATADAGAGAAITYELARRTSIPADGAPHKSLVTTLDLESQLDYVTVPRVAEEAYLRATITNSSQSILLPGRANIFHEADFVGTTRLKTIVPSEEFKVQLGVDDRVKVERKLIALNTGKAIIGNTKRSLYGYRIRLNNHLPRPARVTVYDQAPVSKNELVKVKLQEAAPEPTEVTQLNILKWELNLEPNQEQDVTFTFMVEQPREAIVTGLVE